MTTEMTAPVIDLDERRLPSYVDVLVVGAGISGIGLGHYLATQRPGHSFAIVDAGESLGGTWRTFRYPGIRSDSDMHTFGYAFKPWRSDNSLADSHEILGYLDGVVADDGLGAHLHFGYRVTSASWSSQEERWTVRMLDRRDHEQVITCGFFFSAAGYYDHRAGYTPEFPGAEDFRGTIIHPQDWPEDFDYAGKRVVVIGSGATAVTLIPAMAEATESITMLQRSPSYVIPIPRQDPIAKAIRAVLPAGTAHEVMRKVDIGRNRLVYNLSRRHPKRVRKVIRAINKRSLPADFDVDTHFNPTYNPWDQRLCMVPDGDMFKAISAGKADVVTDHIERFTATGIQLASGRHLDADVIVTATGLQLLAFGGIAFDVDGTPVDIAETVAYKGMMLSGVPNFAFAIGYTNISWTLKVDLVCEHLIRLLDLMDRKGAAVVTPTLDPSVPKPDAPLLDFSAGYVQRSLHLWPRAGGEGAWEFRMDFAFDRDRLRKGEVDDHALAFADSSAPQLLSVGGRQVRVAIAGAPEDPPLLLLHGIGRSLEDWDELTERLADRYRVIRIDLPGFGYSEAAAGEVGLASIARSIPGVLDAVGESRPVHVAGNSLGGAIAMQLLADHPDRVRSLVLLNSAGFGADVIWLLRMLAIPGVGWLATRRTTRSSATMLEQSIFVDRSLITPERVARAVRIGNRPGAGDFMGAMVHALGTWRGVRPEWRAELIRSTVAAQRPTLVAWGDRDRVLPAHHLEAAVQALPHARSHTFVNTGHMPQIERADECAQLIDEFLLAVDGEGVAAAGRAALS